jgi:hypothetical protein
MSWWKYAGGLSPGPAAIPNPANPSGLAARLLRTRRRACGCPRGWITAPQAPPATRGTNARPWSPPKLSATGGPALLLLRLVPRSGPHRPAVFNLPQTPPTSSSSTWQKQRPAIPPSAHPGSAGIRTAPRETVARRQSRLFRALGHCRHPEAACAGPAVTGCQQYMEPGPLPQEHESFQVPRELCNLALSPVLFHT